ncbi:hypothetical protein ROHU_010563 [Labeo rohita]|uniref:Transposase Tc1-like domain-containing protein n=1 Tax=Labeo rohita TaxID=84645 RepID=A0A498LSX9_LABRO|nr:hypothetical protein ROHU_010563 [Labeo rohita]
MVTCKETRAAIIALHKNGFTVKDIVATKTAPKSTIYRIIKNFKERGSILVKKASGRPRKSSKCQDRLLKRIQLRDRSAELAQEWQQAGVSASARTVRPRLLEDGLVSRRAAKKPLLSKKNIRDRLIFCKKYGEWTAEDWGKVIFSDEASFRLFGASGKRLVRRRKDTVFRLQMFLVFCPNVLMFLAFVVWGVSEGSLFETVSCCTLYFLRPLMLLWTAPYVNDFTVMIKSAWDKSPNYSRLEVIIIIILFVIVILFNLFYIIFSFIIVAVLPVILTITRYNWDRTCGHRMGCSPAVRRSVYLTVLILVSAVMVYFYISALENEKALLRGVSVYVFGSVGVVLLNSVALMTELILKTVNSEGVTGDMRIVVFSSEFIFTLFLMILMVFEPWIEPHLQSRQVSIRN